jgi:radical SAM superfamily enzyme YgiQ (UPF0313 family)
MRILLVWPQASHEVLGWGSMGAVAEPLALEYLAAGVKADGLQVRILDLRLEPTGLESTVREFQPDLVGVTGYSMHVLAGLRVCRQAKSLAPHCKTVAGGHHATLRPEDFFEPQMDFVVTGEGIGPLRELLRALEAGRPVKDIPGIWSRAEGEFTFGGNQPPLVLDDLPFPDRSAVAPHRTSYFIDEMRPVALIRTSVGCPYRCNFCSLWKIMDGRYHTSSAGRVVRELADIAEEWVFLVDDEPFVNGRRMLELAATIKAAGIKKRYFAYCRIDTLLREQEMLAAWHEIGLDRLFIGIEAISDEGHQDFNKRLKMAQVEEGLRTARRLNIKVWGQLIVRPNFDRNDFKQMARFVERHGIDRPSFTILTPIPGTELLKDFDSVIERQPNGRPNWALFDCQHPVTETKLSREEFFREYQNLQRIFRGRYVNYWSTEGRPIQAF